MPTPNLGDLIVEQDCLYPVILTKSFGRSLRHVNGVRIGVGIDLLQLLASLTCNQDVLTKINTCTPDLAIVDYSLPDGRCEPIIKKLNQLVRFWSRAGTMNPEDIGRVTWLEKPFGGAKLLSALRGQSG